MRLFSKLYDKVLRWSQHRHAPRYLAGLSFAESSFFPIPPDVMLAPMALSQPQRAWYFAGLTTVASVIGGLAGYLIGVFFFDAISPFLQQHGYWEHFKKAESFFTEYGFWAILIAGFTPLPYKIFTIAAGFVALSLPIFIIGSILSRGTRFFLVAGLMKWGGEPMQERLRHWIDWIGWVVVLVAIILYLVYGGR